MKTQKKRPKLDLNQRANVVVPENGVALKPDTKITYFINKLSAYFKESETGKRFGEAKQVKFKVEYLKQRELKR